VSQPTAFSGDEGVAAEPNGITGQVSAWPADLRLLATGPRPRWFWPATGRTAPIGGLPPQRAGYQFIRAGGGWAAQANPATQAGCGSCAGTPREVYFLADQGSSATPVGPANTVAPGPPGELWLTSYPAAADLGTSAGQAREVSSSGRPQGSPVALPAGYQVEQGTVRGLLLAPVAAGAGSLADKLWDPAAPGRSRTLAGVIAASATQIAWASPCAARCSVQVLNLAAGRQRSVELPVASSTEAGAFSPDSTLLAVQVRFTDYAANGSQPVQLEQVSLASGRLTAVPQTFVSSDAVIGFGWPASSDSLVAELTFTTTVQLASWRPGASRLAIAALSGQPSPGSVIIGQYGH
jgi:hypothetical protein